MPTAEKQLIIKAEGNLPAEMYHINSLYIYIISLLYILFDEFSPSIQQS